MTGRKLLNPLVFTGVDIRDSWLHELKIWKFIKDLEKKQEGPVIYFSLPEKIRSIWRDVKVTHLSKDNDLHLLVNKMKKFHVKDTKAAAYLAYEKSELFKHPAKMNIVHYSNEFEGPYYDKWQRYEMALPSAVSAYSVLQSANLLNQKQQF